MDKAKVREVRQDVAFDLLVATAFVAWDFYHGDGNPWLDRSPVDLDD